MTNFSCFGTEFDFTKNSSNFVYVQATHRKSPFNLTNFSCFGTKNSSNFVYIPATHRKPPFILTNFFSGTERHHKKLLEGIDNLQDIGCFGLTELGYGNNAVEMETTAIYDAKTKEFVVNTPHPLAQKYWITNGAVHAKHVVVMAKLIVDGVNEGIHAVLVPIRDDKLNILPNVLVEDMGHKMGLNGVDNAKLTFNNVRIPRENLLNKYSDVTEEGKFVSEIGNNKKISF